MTTSHTAPPTMTELFGDVIHSYTRADALEDGSLVDVTDTAREAGFVWPVAITRAAWVAYVAVPVGVRAQDETGRLWDVVMMAHFAIKRSRAGGERLPFKLHVRNDNRNRTPPLRTLHLVAGPGDQGEPVIVIMLPEED